MRLSYNLRKEDILTLHKKNLKENSILFKPYIFGVALIIAMLIRFYYGPTHISTYKNGLETVIEVNFIIDSIFYFAIILGIIYFIRNSNIRKASNLISKNSSLVGKREIELTLDKIILISNDSKTEFDISSIKNIVKYEECFLIYFDKDRAIIIPKITFEAEKFINQITEKTKKTFANKL